MKLIVGLGNPGPTYANTRHNAGFLVVDRLAERLHISFGKRRFDAESAETRIGDEQVVLLKPQTFMNLSGRSVGAAAAFFKVGPQDMLIVHDELDLPFGAVRFKQGGGTAGHNGLRSISAQIGGEYLRLRIGVGKPEPPMETVSYVLSAYPSDVREALVKQIDMAAEAVEMWLKEGLQPAMNQVHARQ